MRRKDAMILVVVAVAYAAATVAVGVGLGTGFTTVAIADLSAVVAAVVAFVAVLAARRRRAGAGRQGWAWLAAALACWVVGEVLWTVWEVVLGDEVPYPSIADVAYLAAVPFAVVGIVRFVPPGRGRFGVRSVLDACVIAVSTLFVSWEAALGPAVRAADESVLSRLVSIAYPMTDVVLAALALVVLQWGSSAARRPLALVVVGFVLMAVADTAFTWMINQGTYSGDALVTMLWPLAYLVIAAAARAEAHEEPAAASARSSALALALPYVPLAAALAVAAAHVAGGNPLGPFLGVAGAVLVALVLLRQAVTAWDLRSTVDALHEREAELARLAWSDPLTGLANRARFGVRLEAAVSAGRGRPAVIYVDLDGFKAVNDRFGHDVGDRLLVEAAGRLEACAPSASMLVARLGGDEFVVLVEDGHAAAIDLAQRVLDAFRVPFAVDGETIRFQASVGVASAPEDGSPEEAVRRADAAMYVAKAAGKGRAVDYPDETIVAL